MIVRLNGVLISWRHPMTMQCVVQLYSYGRGTLCSYPLVPFCNQFYAAPQGAAHRRVPEGVSRSVNQRTRPRPNLIFAAPATTVSRLSIQGRTHGPMARPGERVEASGRGHQARRGAALVHRGSGRRAFPLNLEAACVQPHWPM